MTIAIVNYGLGNLGSVARALHKLGCEAEIVSEPEKLGDADRVILPGVGSFLDGVSRLRDQGWYDPIREHALRGRPVLGICLGMQLLATSGSEFGEHLGLGLIPGHVARLDALACRERIPHVGWNDVWRTGSGSELMDGVDDGSDFYFVHSYAFTPDSPAHVIATVDYGVEFPAVVGSSRIFGTQFHPEKSSRAGLLVLGNFCRMTSC